MKINIQQSVLKEQLQFASQFTGDTIPINKYVLLQTDSDNLKVAASSQSGSYVAVVPAEIMEPGAIALPAKLLTDLMSTMADENILLTLNGSKVTIKQGRKRPTVTGMDAEQFPVLPTVPEQKPVSLNTDALKTMLKQTMFSVATDESRPILCGLNLNLNDKLTLSAADGFRSAILSNDSLSGDIEITIPVFILKRILDLDKPVINLYPMQKKIVIESDNILMSSPLIEGQYPNLSPFVDMIKQQNTVVVIDRKKLLNDLESALLFAKEVSLKLKMKFSESDTVEIYTPESQVGHHENVLDCKVTGITQDIMVNCKYMIDTLSAITTDDVKIYLIDSKNPIIIRDNEEKLYSVIMLFNE